MSFSTERPSNSSSVSSFYGGAKRITSFSICKEGVQPEWEDKQNVGGVILSCQWDSMKFEGFENFTKEFQLVILNLILTLLGEKFPHSKLVSS